jgi:multiple sugar transport system permease protein|tara:strand:+ start:1524 stop:2408 length:885 start_codon:yes stop_codon:yes gene_type:complete
MLSKNKTGWLLLSPTIFILILVGLVPFIYVLYVGFFKWNPLAVDPSMQFEGFGFNYRRLIFDEVFLASIWRSIKFAFVTLFFELTLGFVLALSLLSSFPLRSFFRGVHTLPLVIAPIVVGSIFKLFTVQGLGPLPHILKDYFGYTLNYGLNADQAFWMIVIMDIWHWTPFVTLTLLAGLSALPQDPYESAKMDGANNFQIFVYITIPMMVPVLIVVIFIRLMDSLKIVDEIWMLTGGGPGYATRFTGIHIWKEVFEKRFYGLGSAMSILYLYITIVICWILYSVMVSRGQKDED